jgi:hypothetical protein
MVVEAIPAAFVVVVVVDDPLGNVPLAPAPGALNVTVTTLSALPDASFTVT